jgi:hypothetical protein
MSEKILRRLKVLADTAEKEALPTRKFFHIGNAEVIEPYGEMLPLLSWVDDNLSRYVLSTAPSTSWGRIRPAPLVFSLPNRQIAARDGLFLVTGAGQDRAEPHPAGKGTIHIVYLGQPGTLWTGGIARAYIYRLEGVQTKGVLPPPKDGAK